MGEKYNKKPTQRLFPLSSNYNAAFKRSYYFGVILKKSYLMRDEIQGTLCDIKASGGRSWEILHFYSMSSKSLQEEFYFRWKVGKGGEKNIL